MPIAGKSHAVGSDTNGHFALYFARDEVDHRKGVIDGQGYQGFFAISGESQAERIHIFSTARDIDGWTELELTIWAHGGLIEVRPAAGD